MVEAFWKEMGDNHVAADLPSSAVSAGFTEQLDLDLHESELVREQLLAVARDEVPHSIATRVSEWEPPRIRVEILVERDSQKGMVIGKGGAVLKQAGS